MKCIITIELGTNGIRMFAYDLNGQVIGSMRGYYPTFHTEPDHSEQDPEQIFITTLYVLKNILNWDYAAENLAREKNAVRAAAE